jgi:hypothetical protein
MGRPAPGDPGSAPVQAVVARAGPATVTVAVGPGPGAGPKRVGPGQLPSLNCRSHSGQSRSLASVKLEMKVGIH